MYSFVGVNDVDLTIIRNLSLDDMRHFCNANKGNKELCLTDKVLQDKTKLIKQQTDNLIANIHRFTAHGIAIMPYDQTMTFKVFYDITRDMENIYPADALDEFVEFFKIFIGEDDLYHLLFYLVDDIFMDIIEERYVDEYIATTSELKEFLYQCYYNNLILTI